jgi:DNA-binding transcriptional regulator YhcF (GntR family)
LADPHHLDDHEIFDGDHALYAVFKKLCHWAAHADYLDAASRQSLQRGEVLTSERQIAEKLGLSRKLVSRCLRDLEAAQLIEGPAKGPVKAPAGRVIKISNYDGLFCFKKKKEPAKEPVKEPVAENVPLYSINKTTHTLTHASECESPLGEEQPTGPALSDSESSFFNHPLVIEWNAVCITSKLRKVTQCTPSRQKAVAVAMRSKDDLAWWRVVFRQARLPISINGKPWVPRFSQVLELDRAAEYFETAQSKSHIRSVPSNQKEKKVELDSSGNGTLGPLPEGGAKPRQIVEPGRLLRAFLGAEESRNIRKIDGVDTE